MAGNESHRRWIFTEKQFEDTPSRRDNIDPNQELNHRKTGTKLIQCIGQLLKLRQICLNTAFIYFHRFYMFRSFKQYDTNEIGVCALFVASKYNEQPIPLDHVIRAYYSVLNDTKTELTKANQVKDYKILCDNLIANENEMLLIFGFNLSVIHSHAIIVSAGHKLSLKEEITQNAFYIATELIKSSTLCLQYEPSMIACIAIYLSNKLSNITSNDVLDWCRQIDADIKPKMVKEIANKHQTCLTTLNLDFIRNKQRKRTISVCNSSPESAYSSGSNNSPIYDQMDNNCLSPPLSDNSTAKITFNNKKFCSSKSNGSVKHLLVNSTNEKLAIKSSSSVTQNIHSNTDNMINLKCIKREKSSDCVAHTPVKSSTITPTKARNSSEKSKIINLNSFKKERTDDSSAKLCSVLPPLQDPRIERKKIDCIKKEIEFTTNSSTKTNSIIPQNDLNNKNMELKKQELNRNVRKPIVYNDDTNKVSNVSTTEAKTINNSCLVNRLSEATKTPAINSLKYNKKQFQIPKNFMITVNNKDSSSVRTVRECGAND